MAAGVVYTTDVTGITPAELEGFFVDWPSPLSPERHLEVLRGSDHVALARAGEDGPVVGFVTMDMTMVDVTDKSCQVGDVVTFLGRDGPSLLAVADVAAAGGFSPYEVLTGLRGRLPRVYVGDA